MTLFASQTLRYPHKAGSVTWLIENWVSYYGIFIFMGMLASILTIFYFWRRQKYPTEILMTLIIITIPSAIIGARMWHIFEEISAGIDVSGHWWKVNEGGLSVQGGVVVAATMDLLYITTKRKIIDYRQGISFILPTVLIGQAIGRWGNYMNHELFGQIDETGVWTTWLGSTISDNMWISVDGGEPAYRIPLFFYESMASFFGYILIVWIFNFFGWFKPGVTGGMYLVYYGTVRASMEYLRQDPYLLYLIMSIIFISIGLLMMLYFQFLGNYRYYLKPVGQPRVWKLIKNPKAHPNAFEKFFQKVQVDFTKKKLVRSRDKRYQFEKYKIGKMTIHNYVMI